MQKRMSSRGPSQTGSSSQPPMLMSQITRAGSKAVASVIADHKSLSFSIKKGRLATAGEQARQILADKNPYRITGKQCQAPYTNIPRNPG